MKTSILLERKIKVDVIALDVSKGRSFCVLYQNNICKFEGEIKHNKQGFMQILQLVESCDSVPEIVFEATGVYSRAIERFCQNNNFRYYLLNPLEARKQTDSLRVNKTDISDAHKLAQTHYFHERKLTNNFTPEYQKMRQLSRWYESNEQEIKKSRSQLHVFLVQSFPEYEKYFSSISSEFALDIIQLFPHPKWLKGLSRTKIKNLILKATRKKISSQRALIKAEELLSLSELSYPAVLEDSIEVRLVAHWANELLQLVLLKKEIKKELIDKAVHFKEFYIYNSFPGIGELTAALLIAELGDLTRFDNPKQLNAYVGIDIQRYQSGNSGTYDRISKRGNTLARKILFNTVNNMIRSQKSGPNHIVDYYYRAKEKPRAKKHKVALIGCMDRFLKSIHNLVLLGQLYDYDLSPQ